MKTEIVSSLKLLLVVLLTSAVTTLSIADVVPSSMTNENYKYAVSDAQNPEPHEIYNYLIAIKEDNSNIITRGKGENLQVKVISIIDEATYNEHYKGKDFKKYSLYPDLWVSVEPELIEKIKKNKQRFNGTDEENKMSIREIFGFPPQKKVDRVVVFWADAKNMFRPAPDQEIDDESAEINFPDDVTPEHRRFIDETRSSQYFAGKEVVLENGKFVKEEWKEAYPWTQLGYSYDWGNKSDNIYNYGLSEFIVKGNKNRKGTHNIEIEKIPKMKDYINNAKDSNNI
jgi:hypothetical protein